MRKLIIIISVLVSFPFISSARENNSVDCDKLIGNLKKYNYLPKNPYTDKSQVSHILYLLEQAKIAGTGILEQSLLLAAIATGNTVNSVNFFIDNSVLTVTLNFEREAIPLINHKVYTFTCVQPETPRGG